MEGFYLKRDQKETPHGVPHVTISNMITAYDRLIKCHAKLIAHVPAHMG